MSARERLETDGYDHIVIGGVLLLGQRRLRRGPKHSAVPLPGGLDPAEPTENHDGPTPTVIEPWSEHRAREAVLAALKASAANGEAEPPKRVPFLARTIGATTHPTEWVASAVDLVRDGPSVVPPIRFAEVEPWNLEGDMGDRMTRTASALIVGPLPSLIEEWD